MCGIVGYIVGVSVVDSVEIMYGDKYGIESAVFVEVFKLAEQKVDAKMIREQLNTIYVKHALLVAKKMHDEGDCISDDGITIVF